MDQLNFRNMLLAYHAVHDEVLCESMDELGFFDEQEQLNEVSVAMKRRAADASAAKAAKADQAARQSRRDMSPSAPYMQMMSDRATKQHRRLVKAAYPSGRRKKVAEELGFFEDISEEGQNPYRTVHGTSVNAAGKRIPWRDQATPSGTTYIDGKPQMRRSSPKEQEMSSKFKSKQSRMEEYELYELVLEHLLDEGYVDTVEGALAILENMSDEWLEGILNEEIPAHLRGQSLSDYNVSQRRQAEERRKRGAKQPGWKELRTAGTLITVHPGNPDEAREALRKTKPNPDSRIMGKYNPNTIKLQDIINKLPENSPGAKRKPRRVLPDPDRSNREPAKKPRRVIPRRRSAD